MDGWRHLTIYKAENHIDLFCLFCTSIQTEQVRKFIVALIIPFVLLQNNFQWKCLNKLLENVRLACDHLFGKLLFTWLSLVMSMMVSFVLSFFPRDVLDEILNLIESVSEDFPSYSAGPEETAKTSYIIRTPSSAKRFRKQTPDDKLK